MLGFMKPLGLVAALAAAAAVPAPALAAPEATSDAAQPVSTASAGDAQIVVRDAATGRIRVPTAEEAQALHNHSRALRRANSPAVPEAKSHWSGARGARLSDDFMTYTVVVKNADGSLVELCIEGTEATAKVLKSAPLAKPATLATE